MDSLANVDATCLDKTRQIKYWTRCLKSLLPHHYTGNESNRMYLAFFIISALDLLDAFKTVTSEEERNEYADWIYHCQHAGGGFRMWPGTDFGDRANESNAMWDPANIPATYFALSCLLIIGDDLKRVRRPEALRWLRKMQRKDGSFGETLVNGRIEGGQDPRFGYCATGVRHILRGNTEGPLSIRGDDIEDIDIDKLVHCINLAESFDGGIADEPFHEPHSGYTFCALGALRFVQRLSSSSQRSNSKLLGPPNPRLTLEWLLACQTGNIDPDNEVSDDINVNTYAVQSGDAAASESLYQSPGKSTFSPPFGPNITNAGMSGRPNKVADTCYAWWAAASTHILEQPLYDQAAMQRYLLNQTQHSVLGGFGKFPGYLPDLYHSYLALAALGLVNTNGVKDVDSCMCLSKEAAARLPGLWQSFEE